MTDNPDREKNTSASLLCEDYTPILRFATECNNITYERFDHYTVNRVNLFAIRESFDFDALDASLDRILKDLPSLKRIFAKPIIRLKDTGDILPVESVRIVNNRTIEHASRHSEMWDNITSDGLRPKKLLTVKHEDDYAIYENLVFARVVNIILSYVSSNIRLLTNMLYTDKDMHVNLLERVNHLQYFLAVGKLHIGYVRDYDKYRPTAERCLDKLMFIERTLRARAGSPVYKKCKGYKSTLTLKKTNVFRMHKDYHRVYLLYKYFSEIKADEIENDTALSGKSKAGYILFCSMLTIFAAGHFNFIFPQDEKMDFFALKTEARFLDWKMRIETQSLADSIVLLLTFSKDRDYRILLSPCFDADREVNVPMKIRNAIPADEYIAVSPYTSDGDAVLLSLFDIDSFRRLQQIFLRGMLCSDKARSICPFCGKPLRSVNEGAGNAYECTSCRIRILSRTCPETGEDYTATELKNYRPSRDSFSRSLSKDRFLYDRFIESQMHYVNITKLSDGAKMICPRCKKIH